MSKKKIKEIIIGSNKHGKIKEIRDLLTKKYKIFSPNYFQNLSKNVMMLSLMVNLS